MNFKNKLSTMEKPEYLFELLKAFTELEMQSFISQLAEHLEREKMDHLIFNEFSVVDEDDLDDLRGEVAELEEKNDRLQDKLDEIKSIAT
jgi:hypothetical protein